ANLEVDLLAKDRDGARRFDPDPDLLAHDREDRDLDVVPDHDALIGLSRKDEHGASRQPYLSPRPIVMSARHAIGILSSPAESFRLPAFYGWVKPVGRVPRSWPAGRSSLNLTRFGRGWARGGPMPGSLIS